MSEKQKKSTNKKSSKHNKSNKAISVRFSAIIILVIVLIVVLLITNKDKIKEKVGKSENTEIEQETEQEVPEYSLIDMNNTENAKISEGTKQNTSSKLAEEKTYKGMKVKDIKLIAEGGITRLTATVENTTSKNYEGGEVTIIFQNSDGSEFARLKGILPAIDSGKSNELDAGTTADIANAYDFTFEK